jgi:hypothetical protein
MTATIQRQLEAALATHWRYPRLMVRELVQMYGVPQAAKVVSKQSGMAISSYELYGYLKRTGSYQQ